MKNRYSYLACFLISITLLAVRLSYSKLKSDSPLIVTTWDALGYYFYLPSVLIYHDFTELKWFPEIDKKYSVSGGQLYQAGKCNNGNYAFNYLGGVSIMESPFFLAAHEIAKTAGYDQDGFSPPYQYAIAFSAVFYCILALFLLRKILLNYFDDVTTAVTLLLLLLASNFVQYVSIDGAMSHSFIFLLYVLILYATMKWHQKPGIAWASLAGFVIGLAAISRPTEAIMLFIPLLWNTQNKEASAAKWDLVRQNKKHLFFIVASGFIGILPQLIYWKAATGSFLYDVGSKWEFLSPHFRVLFGWEKGWFIYTPVTVFFILGLFFIKEFPFKKSVIAFCLLNIYIIISWHDWRYGASYSCRALVQSYPVFALPLAAIIRQVNLKRWRYLFYALGIYLIGVNLFQIKQYNDTVLHYDDMNRKYYCSIYLNPNPSPLDMSLLDTDEMPGDENDYSKETVKTIDSTLQVKLTPYSSRLLFETKIGNDVKERSLHWIKIESKIKINQGTWGCFMNSELQQGDSIKHIKIRLNNAISPIGKINDYAFYVKIPDDSKQNTFRLFLNASFEFEGELSLLRITFLRKKEK